MASVVANASKFIRAQPITRAMTLELTNTLTHYSSPPGRIYLSHIRNELSKYSEYGRKLDAILERLRDKNMERHVTNLYRSVYHTLYQQWPEYGVQHGIPAQLWWKNLIFNVLDQCGVINDQGSGLREIDPNSQLVFFNQYSKNDLKTIENNKEFMTFNGSTDDSSNSDVDNTQVLMIQGRPIYVNKDGTQFRKQKYFVKKGYSDKGMFADGLEDVADWHEKQVAIWTEYERKMSQSYRRESMDTSNVLVELADSERSHNKVSIKFDDIWLPIWQDFLKPSSFSLFDDSRSFCKFVTSHYHEPVVLGVFGCLCFIL